MKIYASRNDIITSSLFKRGGTLSDKDLIKVPDRLTYRQLTENLENYECYQTYNNVKFYYVKRGENVTVYIRKSNPSTINWLWTINNTIFTY